MELIVVDARSDLEASAFCTEVIANLARALRLIGFDPCTGGLAGRVTERRRIG